MTQVPRYGSDALKIEPYGIDTIAAQERHGRIAGQFTLWLGSNLTIADFALGFFPVSLGLSWDWTIAALVIGNILGGLALGLCAGMGPTFGLPQLMISRRLFGSRTGLVPAFLNYLSTIGWFSVNNILGSYGLRVLFPGLAFWQAALMLVVVQGLIAVFGHNLIHLYERVMSIVLGLLFALLSVMILRRRALFAYHGAPHSDPWIAFALVVAAALSYLGSWAPYASDYSRYLPSTVRRRQVIQASFWGGLLGSLWLELVGAGVAAISRNPNGNPIATLHQVASGLGLVAVLAIILGGTAADALNLYSNALAAAVLNIRLPRWTLAVVASLVGLGLSLAGSGSFEGYYDNFLLLLGYWLTPWLGVMLVDFYWVRRVLPTSVAPPWSRPQLGSFLIGLAVSVPFMSSTLYTGPVAHWLGGADLTFYVGFVVSGGVYTLWAGALSKDPKGVAGGQDGRD
ncbi:MAG: allantoin permease [Sulfobacillus acidophilus]|uniref:Allantoin permease n=1 Tax=Sulfobacillus acidophilus TaxID=53633 RepID=A0A2T2WIC9_9FIRM|nr:MAG: allantoin permease [Sulfobacillus acidophilus]